MRKAKKLISMLISCCISGVMILNCNANVFLNEIVTYAQETGLESYLEMDSVKQQAADVREHLKNWETEFTVEKQIDTIPDDVGLYEQAVYNLALEHTGVDNEGDYIRWQIKNYCTSISCIENENGCLMSISYEVSYYTSKEQEKLLDEKIDTILNFLDLEGKTEYEKILSIYNYACQNVKYDWSGLDDETQIEHSAYAALCEKEAVCQGFAAALYRLMLQSGIDCRIITGTNYDVAHAWNIFELDGTYYYADASSDSEKKEYTYFMKCLSDISGFVCDEEYTSDEFLNEYRICTESYVDSENAITENYNGFVYAPSVDYITISSYTGNDEHVIVPAEINGIPVKRITQYAFYNSDTVKIIEFSEGIEELGSLFVYGYSALETIIIPSTMRFSSQSSDGYVTGIAGVVDWCENVAEIRVAEDNPYMMVEDGVLYSIDKSVLIFYPRAKTDKTFTVPEDVVSINDDAFANNIYLEEVIIPDSVTYIGYWAFNCCFNLSKVNIPENDTFIGQFAFQTTSVEEFTIPAGFTGELYMDTFRNVPLKNIYVEEGNEKYSFVNNCLLKEYGEDTVMIMYASDGSEDTCIIPDNVTEIWGQVFDGADNLTKIVIGESLKSITSRLFLTTNITEFEVSEDNENIEIKNNSVYCNGKLIVCANKNIGGELVITSEGTDIPDFAYFSCRNLESVVIADGIECIGWEAFSGCSELKSVVLPNTLVSIGNTAFSNCSKLESVTIPASVKNIGSMAFGCCNILKKIVIENPECEIFDSCETIFNTHIGENAEPHFDGTIYGYDNSTAQAYAEKYGYKFESLGEAPVITTPVVTTVVTTTITTTTVETTSLTTSESAKVSTTETTKEVTTATANSTTKITTTNKVETTSLTTSSKTSTSESTIVSTTATAVTTIITTQVTEESNGDANGDTEVNVRDCAYIASMIANGRNDKLPQTADFNGDGKVNVRDAAAIARYLAAK